MARYGLSKEKVLLGKKISYAVRRYKRNNAEVATQILYMLSREWPCGDFGAVINEVNILTR